MIPPLLTEALSRQPLDAAAIDRARCALAGDSQSEASARARGGAGRLVGMSGKHNKEPIGRPERTFEDLLVLGGFGETTEARETCVSASPERAPVLALGN